MKTRIHSILTLGIALAAAVAGHAQTATLSADVPFSFHAGVNTMAAGTYRIDEAPNGAAAWLSSNWKSSAEAVTTMKVIGKEVSEPARLVFHRYGTEYFLCQIWTGTGSIGHAVPRSSREKELAKRHGEGALAVIRAAERGDTRDRFAGAGSRRRTSSPLRSRFRLG